MNQLLSAPPFDLYELMLFQLVAEAGSFTRAAERAGLTQSAITRQIRGMEDRLGARLFERTTRRVSLTRAGRMVREKSQIILEATNSLFGELEEAFGRAPPTLRVGVARSIGLGYLPGYFFAFHRKHPEVQLQLVQQTSPEILESVEGGQLDVGLVCAPRRLARALEVTHRFDDAFTAILPPRSPVCPKITSASVDQLKSALIGQRWLLIDREEFTGRQLDEWLKNHGWNLEPAMELDSFDVIVNLVSLGLGVSLVPRRVLPIYIASRAVRRIAMEPRFSRDLAVVVRRNRRPSEPLRAFVESILF